MKSSKFSVILTISILICFTHGQREYPPIIDPIDFKDSKVYHADNTKVILACNADANPPARYEWTFNGNDVQSEFIDVDEYTGELQITSLTAREVGAFQCRAYNILAEKKIVSMSPIVNVLRSYIDTWPPMSTSRITSTEGDPVKIACDEPPNSSPSRIFKWYKQDESGGEIARDKRISVDQEGSLHFAYVIKGQDDSRNQEYKCAILNKDLDTIKLGSPKILDVQERTPITEFQPAAVYVSTPLVAILKHNIDLECVFSGNPLPDITWIDNYQNPVVANTRFELLQYGRVLRIKGVMETDEGTFTCKGSNNRGNNERTIDLDVTSGPIWTEALISQTVAEGRNAVFTCKARPAKGEAELAAPEWLENGKLIPRDKFESKYEFSDNKQVLTVKNLVKPDDITCFQCTVKNKIGSEFDDGCLDVIEPITITHRPPPVQRITKGVIVNLTVTATTDPTLTLQYKWYFSGQSYDDSPPFVSYDPITMVASIDTEQLSSEDYKGINGTYIREIFHKFERVNISMEVLLEEVGIVGPIQAAGADLWWIALVIGILLLVVVIAIICVVCRRKAQEGVYPLGKKEIDNNLDPEKDLADSGFHDLSRADYDGPQKKGDPLHFTEEPLSYEDDDSLAEYGEDVGKFNEDGSFIGQYVEKKFVTPVQQTGNETAI